MKAANLELLERNQLPPPQARAILQAMEAEMDARDGVLATKGDIHVLDLKIEALRAGMATKSDLLGLELKIENIRSELVRWNFAFWIAQLAAVAGLIKVFK